TEPHTPHPRKRIEAAAELVRAGIPTGVLVAPLIPGVNDDPKRVERILELLADAGVDSVGGIGLYLRGEVREIWFDWLRQYRPDLLARYEELYARGAYLPRAEAERLSAMARGGAKRRRRSTSRRAAGSDGVAVRGEPPREAQRTLF
ncbi:MAG: radical SAM protein, partial [Solirubrobacterales bacterium]